MKKTINICIRKTKSGQFKDSLDIVILDEAADNYGQKLNCFGNVGTLNSGYCHSIGSYEYFVASTKKATKKESENIMKCFLNIYFDYKVNIHEKMTRKYIK
tara:strand:+ start:1874 stop:2176 length:303 start_codon:yes stop_codon:yes gene_type:complete